MGNLEEDCKRTLESFRSRAEKIAEASSPPPSTSAPGAELVAGGVGKVVSEFVRSQGLDSLISGKTAGSAARKWVKQSAKEQARKAKEAWHQSQLKEFNHLSQEVETYLGTISMPSPSLTPEGNSHRLLRKLGKVHRLKSPDSKARGLVSVLDEIRGLGPIPNDSIPVYLAEKDVKSREEAVQLVRTLEEELRKLVKERLSRVTPK
ncbi:MAG: hypothetical protein ACE5IJ_09385 [Thermoplasmata archaeon]